jgi:hypothetical protein
MRLYNNTIHQDHQGEHTLPHSWIQTVPMTMKKKSWAEQNLAVTEVIQRIDEQLSAGEQDYRETITHHSDWYEQAAERYSELYNIWFGQHLPSPTHAQEIMRQWTTAHPNIYRITMTYDADNYPTNTSPNTP